MSAGTRPEFGGFWLGDIKMGFCVALHPILEISGGIFIIENLTSCQRNDLLKYRLCHGVTNSMNS